MSYGMSEVVGVHQGNLTMMKMRKKMEMELLISIGSRVMLTSNLWIDVGGS